MAQRSPDEYLESLKRMKPIAPDRNRDAPPANNTSDGRRESSSSDSSPFWEFAATSIVFAMIILLAIVGLVALVFFGCIQFLSSGIGG